MLVGTEEAFIDLVKASALKDRLRTIDAVDQVTPDMIRRMVASAPAVYVLVRHSRIERASARVTADVLCLARNARGGKAARHGDASAIGAYEIADAIVALCNNLNAGFTPTDAKVDRNPAWPAAQLAAVVVTVQNSVTAPTGLDLDKLADFATFDAQYDIPPHEDGTEHDKWLEEPPDHTTSEPDAHDTQTGLDQ